MRGWCGWLGSNQRPLASEANTLSTELQPRRWSDAKDTVFPQRRLWVPETAGGNCVSINDFWVYNRARMTLQTSIRSSAGDRFF